MRKNHNQAPNYPLRRTIAGIAALALAGGVAEAGKAIYDRATYEHRTVQVPPAGGEYKTFHLNEQFAVGDKEVTVDSLSMASQLAGLPGVDSRATLAMLEEQLPKGMSPTDIPGDMIFKLPSNSQIGDLHTGE